MEFFITLILASIGGALGASISALGGFVLFGLWGVIGYISLLWGGRDSWLSVHLSATILVPSVCFVGGSVATAYARKNRAIQCGKDIGRSLISLRDFRVILVGAVAGVVGYLVSLLFSNIFGEKLDTVALTVLFVPLVLKYAWNLRVTNDCEGTSHIVPSPYRFFEKLATGGGKIGLSAVIAIVTVAVTFALSLDNATKPFASMAMFFLSALSLYLLFFNIPIPATHHFSGPVGVVVVQLFLHSEISLTLQGAILPLLWGVAISAVSLLGSDITKRYLFNDGDIHIDPPAGGIVISTAVALWLFPILGVYEFSTLGQVVTASLILVLATTISYRFFRNE